MLYLVATPIGNLGDITYRAVEVLKNVDLIASEDSRKSSILLNHYSISKPQTALNNFNERKVVPKLIERLERGETIALITSAGTPGISDPGYLLVHAALEAGLQVEVIPGPSAVITALTLADLPLHSFTFKGFPPNRKDRVSGLLRWRPKIHTRWCSTKAHTAWSLFSRMLWKSWATGGLWWQMI